MSIENKNILLLSGPQHTDEKRPITAVIRRDFEHVDPLGIAIVAAVLKEHGLKTHWLPMEMGKTASLEGAIENAGAVFISSRFIDTTSANEAIEIANKHHKPSVVGGYSPTFTPDLLPNATTRVQGEAEGMMGEIIHDLLNGGLKDIYNAGYPPHDITKEYIWPDRSIFPSWRWPVSARKKHSIEIQRGCPNVCTFCSPTKMQAVNIVNRERKVRVRRFEDIKAEIEEGMGLKRNDFLFFADLNTTAIPPEEQRRLYSYLQEKGIRWFTEGTVAPLIDDFESRGEEGSLLKLMSAKDGKGGCYSFLYGADDLVRAKVAGSKDKELSLLEKATRIFRQMGIPLNLSVVVGLDNHTFPDSFYQIAEVIKHLRNPYSFIHIATPYLGTVWGNEVDRQGRIFDTEPSHYNHRTVVMQPKNMTPEELQQGYYWLLGYLHSASQISKTSRANFSAQLAVKNLTLATIQSGVPWGTETYLSTLELGARGFINFRIQKELDAGYESWSRLSG